MRTSDYWFFRAWTPSLSNMQKVHTYVRTFALFRNRDSKCPSLKESLIKQTLIYLCSAHLRLSFCLTSGSDDIVEYSGLERDGRDELIPQIILCLQNMLAFYILQYCHLLDGFMRICTSISSGFSNNADCTRFFHPFLGA